MIETFTFHTDPGHGWLEVPMDVIMSLNIGEKVSHFSYRKGNMAYLEEDCDASLFIDAMKAVGREFKFVDVDHRNEAPCRRYGRFTNR